MKNCGIFLFGELKNEFESTAPVGAIIDRPLLRLLPRSVPPCRGDPCGRPFVRFYCYAAVIEIFSSAVRGAGPFPFLGCTMQVQQQKE
jgi:hypothetical protein